MSHPLARKILLVGWDTADWKVVSPMLDAGELPSLAGLVERDCRTTVRDRPARLALALALALDVDRHGATGRRA